MKQRLVGLDPEWEGGTGKKYVDPATHLEVEVSNDRHNLRVRLHPTTTRKPESVTTVAYFRIKNKTVLKDMIVSLIEQYHDLED